MSISWERIWPRLAPVLSVVGLYASLSWLGFWRLGSDALRIGMLAVLGVALLWTLAPLLRLRNPSRLDSMRRVEQRSGLAHRPARGLADRMSPVAADGPARSLWAAEQERLYASLKSLRAGAPRPDLARRDRNGWRFAVPVLLALAFAVAWGEWLPRLGEAFAPVAAASRPVVARVDAWIDPPPYTGRPPVFLSRLGPESLARIEAPEGSKLTVRVASREPAQVSMQSGGAAAAMLSPKETGDAAAAIPDGAPAPSASDEAGQVRSYEAVLDRDATVTIAHADGTVAYPIVVIEDLPPTVARGPLTVNRAGSFTLDYQVGDDYGVTEGTVTFRSAEPPAVGARPLVEDPTVALRVDRAQAKSGTGRATGRLESHPLAGGQVRADVVVKDAAGQEGRPPDDGVMTMPARAFYNPLARALVEQRRVLALDANRRDIVATALDALTVAPERLKDSGAYLGLRVAYHRLLDAHDDNDLRAMLDLLWDMARDIEDGEVSGAQEKLNAARQALEQALKDGAPKEEIARLMDELRQAMQEFMQSYAAEMAKRGMQNTPATPDENMQTLSEQDLQKMLDRIEDLAQLGENDAAQELLSQLQQMLDNLEMAQPGEMQPADEEAMRQMDELAKIMREQQKLMDDTFQLNQGRRPQEGRPGQQSGEQEPLTPEEFEELARQLQEGQGQLTERLQKLLEELQKGQGQPGEQGEGGQMGEQGQPGEGGQEGQGGQGQMGEGSRALGRAGRAMGDASRSLGAQEPGSAYGHQGDALSALRDGMQGMMQQMFANQPGGQPGQQPGRGGRQNGSDDPLGRPQRNEGPDLGQNVKVPDEIDVERARRILDAIRGKLGERFRPSYELEYLERLIRPD